MSLPPSSPADDDIIVVPTLWTGAAEYWSLSDWLEEVLYPTQKNMYLLRQHLDNHVAKIR